MSPLLFYKQSSFKKQTAIVLVTLAVIVALPAIAVATAAQSGLSTVSSALAFFNPVTHTVEVKDTDGKIVKQIQASTVWPVKGYVSLEFGMPDPPYQEHHTGIDIANPKGQSGDPITTFMVGKVLKVDSNPNNKSGYGEYVVIDHGNGITSLYGHMSQTEAVAKQDVKPGDLIGYEGSTGHSTGPHVHFEIRISGLPVNPRIFMVGNPTP